MDGKKGVYDQVRSVQQPFEPSMQCSRLDIGRLVMVERWDKSNRLCFTSGLTHNPGGRYSIHRLPNRLHGEPLERAVYGAHYPTVSSGDPSHCGIGEPI